MPGGGTNQGWSLDDFDLATQWPWLFVGFVAVLLLGLLLALALRAPHPRAPFAALVGVTAGLQTAQVSGIHIFCLAVAAWLLFGVTRERTGRPKFAEPLLVVTCAVLLACTALFGEMVNNRLTAIQLVMLAATAGCLAAFGSRVDLRPALLGVLTVISIGSLVGIMQYVGVIPYAGFLGTRRPIGIYVEPDWLGMYSAVALVIAYRVRTGKWRTPLVCVNLVALMLAAARAAWLAVIVICVLGWIITRCTDPSPSEEPRARGGERFLFIGAALVVVVALVASPKLLDSLVDRVAGTSASQPDVGAMARKQQTNSLLTLNSAAPWNGLGLSASGRVGVSGRIDYMGTAKNNVASNWVLGWWVEGGWLAVPLILFFLYSPIRRLNATSGMTMTVVLISSLFSNAMVIPISWFCMALCLMNTERRSDDLPAGQQRDRISGVDDRVPSDNLASR